MQKIIDWLKSKNINSHAVAGAIIAVAALVVEDQQVRDFVISTFQSHPKIVSAVLSGAGIIFKYSHSSNGVSDAQAPAAPAVADKPAN